MCEKTEKFIERVDAFHQGKYDYSKTVYIKCKQKVCIICPVHGEFWQTPSNHYKRGCAACTNNKKKTTQEFIELSNKVHNNFYDYSKVKYKNKDTKVCIICPIHGEFWQIPHNHLYHERGCSKCSWTGAEPKTHERFLDQCLEIHGDRYLYSKSKYINAHSKIEIICPVHGSFYQTPASHLTGRGCKKCSISCGWGASEWKASAKQSKHFSSYKFYVLKLSNDNEIFYKIGRTFTDIGKRFCGSLKMPYNYEIIKILTGTAEEMWDLEYLVKQELATFNYSPKIKFDGMTECYANIPIIWQIS